MPTPAQPPASSPRTAPAAKGAGGGLSKKVGPLPVWGWAAIGVIGGVVFIWYRNRQASNAAAAANTAADTSSTGSTDTSGGDVTGQSAAAIQSEVQQLQGAESEQEQDITEQGKQEKQTAGEVVGTKKSDTRQAAEIEALQDKEQGEKKRPGPKKKPPAKRPAPRKKPVTIPIRGGGGGGPVTIQHRNRKPPVRKQK